MRPIRDASASNLRRIFAARAAHFGLGWVGLTRSVRCGSCSSAHSPRFTESAPESSVVCLNRPVRSHVVCSDSRAFEYKNGLSSVFAVGPATVLYDT